MDFKGSTMSEAQRIILDAVNNIVKTNPGGEKFFDELDEFLKTSPDAVYSELIASIIPGETLVLSGGFGRVVSDRIDRGELPKLPYILFKGGLRGDNKPEVLRVTDNVTANGVFVDDTIYGGKTYFKIQAYLESHAIIRARRCLVIYDGSPHARNGISSLFRYYDYFKAVPNFKF